MRIRKPADPEDLEKVMQADAFIHWACRGHDDAVRLIMDFGFVAHLWDDLIDKDRPISDDSINAAFTKLLVDIPRNPFFTDFRLELLPVIREGISAFMDSVALEKRRGEDDLVVAYTMRILVNQLLPTCAFIIGGWDWSREVCLKMRLDDGMRDGTFQEYLDTVPQHE